MSDSSQVKTWEDVVKVYQFLIGNVRQKLAAFDDLTAATAYFEYQFLIGNVRQEKVVKANLSTARKYQFLIGNVRQYTVEDWIDYVEIIRINSS